MDVWLQGQLSHLLPAGALLSKRFLWEASSPDIAPLIELLRRVPRCAPIAFSLYPIKQGATAFVWVDAPVNIKGSNSKTALSKQDAGKCLEDVAKSLSLSLDDLVLSQHKASRARNHLFW